MNTEILNYTIQSTKRFEKPGEVEIPEQWKHIITQNGKYKTWSQMI